MTKNGLYTYQDKQKFYNKQPFPSQLRMVIIGYSSKGTAKLLYKVFLKQFLDFQKIIFVSPSISQKKYEVIIKSLQKGLSMNQIKTIFEEQKHITNIDMALDIITLCKQFKSC